MLSVWDIVKRLGLGLGLGTGIEDWDRGLGSGTRIGDCPLALQADWADSIPVRFRLLYKVSKAKEP